MRLPGVNRNYQNHVGYGGYVAARLRQAKRDEQAADVEAASALVKERGRAWEDATEALSAKGALRDGLDDELDAAAQEFRLKLASRYVGADRQAPYSAIFPKGIAYYTASPLAENEARYRELLARAQAELAPDDPDLGALAASVPALLEAMRPALGALSEARTHAGMMRTALEASVDAWRVQLERSYGALVMDLGRRNAERFFPKTTSTRSTATPNDATPPPA